MEWRELYRTALLELRPEDLRWRVAEAEKAIQQRIVELRQDDSSAGEERRALDDALRSLRVLITNECGPPHSISPVPERNKAIS